MAKAKTTKALAHSYPLNASFGELLQWHLRIWGTTPGCSITKKNTPWILTNFAQLMCEVSTDDLIALESAAKILRDWRTDAHLPNEVDTRRVENIYRLLFDDDPNLQKWKSDLSDALENGRRAKIAASPKRPASNEGAVPKPTSHFVGRLADVRVLISALLSEEASSAVLVQGGPGMGKTELTKAVAHHDKVVELFGERRWFISLQTANTAEAMKAAISRELGYDPKSGFPATLIRLRGKRTLLVLDNLETPWESKEEREKTSDALATLSEVPGLTLMASFRGFDEVGGPRWRSHSVWPLSRPEATDLFASIGGEWVLADSYLDNFIDALGGIPLAVDLIARRVRGRSSLALLWREWIKVGSDFAKRRDLAEGPLTSLPHSIELSLLSPRVATNEDALRLFRLLGCLPAGILPDDRDTLIGEHAYDAEECLFSAGLATEQGERIDLLPPIRAHAAKYHRPLDRDAVTWIEFFLGTMSAFAQLPIGQFGRDFDRIYSDFPNIESAMLAAPHSNAMKVLDGFIRLAQRLWHLSPALSELFKRSKARDDKLGMAKCLWGLGEMAIRLAECELADFALLQARSIYRELSDMLGEARCIKGLGDICQTNAKFKEARSLYEQALLSFETAHDSAEVASCTLNIAEVDFLLSQIVSAENGYQKSLAIFRELNDSLGEARCLMGLGSILYFTSGAGMLEYYERALLLFCEVGDRGGEAECLCALGDVAALHSEYQTASMHYETALSFFQNSADVRLNANCLLRLGELACIRLEYEHARGAFEKALLLYKQIDDKQGIANCLKGLGQVTRGLGQHDSAHELYSEAAGLYVEVGSHFGEAETTYCLGQLAFGCSKFDEARSLLVRAASLFKGIGNVLGEANCLFYLSEVALASDLDKATAFTALEKAFSMYQQVGQLLGQANCVLRFGDIAFSRGDETSAKKAYEEAFGTYVKIGDIKGQANSLRGVAVVTFGHSQYESASSAYEKAALLYREMNKLDDEAVCLIGLAEACLRLGVRERALSALIRSQTIYQLLRNVQGEAFCAQAILDCGT